MRIEAFLQQSPLFAIRRASRRFDTHLPRILPEGGKTTFLEALVLAALFFEEPKTVKPSDLADTLSTTRGNISHCISALEARGLIRRRIDPRDARAFHVVLKPEGRNHAIRVIRALDKLQKDFEKQVAAADLRLALSTIDQIEKLCARRAGES